MASQAFVPTPYVKKKVGTSRHLYFIFGTLRLPRPEFGPCRVGVCLLEGCEQIGLAAAAQTKYSLAVSSVACRQMTSSVTNSQFDFSEERYTTTPAIPPDLFNLCWLHIHAQSKTLCEQSRKAFLSVIFRIAAQQRRSTTYVSEGLSSSQRKRMALATQPVGLESVGKSRVTATPTVVFHEPSAFSS